MLLKRVLFKRVERWINSLEPEYRTRGFIKASLGLFRIVGLPTEFGGVIQQKRNSEVDIVASLTSSIANLDESRRKHDERREELNELGRLLS